MAFEGLTDKITAVFQKLKSRGRLTEADIKLAMREIRVALLEADVNFRVVKDFIARVSERAQGSDVLESLTPAQQVVKIVHDELTALMGGHDAKLILSPQPPTIVMSVGLQGSGKTTNTAKLANYYKSKHGKNPLLAACDIYRPAAINQLKVLGESLKIPVFDMGTENPAKILSSAIAHAKKNGHDMVFCDTAGRLHIDEALMDELKTMKKTANPSEILLFIDAMTGQDAVSAATAFDEALGITGVFVTKLDGDTRGGAALSVKAATGRDIKFIGTGEKLDAIEPFYPERMASRILGMGDVLTLIEKAQQTFDEKKAIELEQKMRQNKLTLTDFYEQISSMKNMGSISDILGMMPGVNAKALSGAQLDERAMAHTEAIILSMTPYERDNPNVLNYSRKKRIAAGCGLKVEDINRLLKQFDSVQKLTKQMSGKKGKRRGGMPGGMRFPF